MLSTQQNFLRTGQYEEVRILVLVHLYVIICLVVNTQCKQRDDVTLSSMLFV